MMSHDKLKFYKKNRTFDKNNTLTRSATYLLKKRPHLLIWKKPSEHITSNIWDKLTLHFVKEIECILGTKFRKKTLTTHNIRYLTSKNT